MTFPNVFHSNRRDFLRKVPLAAAAGALSAAHAENAQISSSHPHPTRIEGVQLAIATICTDGFGNHGHEPAFRILPELGFRNVEFNVWYPNTITPSYVRSIQERCEQTGLKPISLQGSVFGGGDADGIIKDLAHKIVLMQGCKQLGCHRIKCTGSARGQNGGLQAVIEVCKELAPVAEELEILVTLENHANNVLEQMEDYDEIFSVIDSPYIGMCLDTGHFEGVNVDLHEVIDRFHERIYHVDLKDCKARGKGHNTVPFGEGVTDFNAFLQHLLEKNYTGYLVVEQAWREPQGDWVENLRKAHQLFTKWER